ncbi:MAG: M16 family metallopeptidase [Lautropia sp.]
MDLSTRTLANGLTIASVRLPAFRTLALGAFVRAGARDEPARLNGLSHFLEHMAFKGTETRDARALSIAIERVGASMNAYTTKDHTVYHADALAGAEPIVLDVLADVVRRSTFPPAEIDRERRVILQEIDEAADDPESLAQDAFDQLAFPKQAIGRPILGTRRQVNAIGRDDLVGYHAAHYGAASLVVVGAGALDHERFAAEVERQFGDLPRGQPVVREPARYVGGFRHIEQDFDQTSVILGWPVPPRSDAAFTTYELLADLLGGGASSPLFQTVREQHGLAYRVDAWIDGHDDGGTLQIAAGVGGRSLNAFFDRVGETIVALTRQVAPEDLERTHNQRVLLLAHQHERPMDLVEAVAQDLLVHGRVATPDERIAAARAIDGDALAAAARSLVAAAPTLALVGRAGRGDHLAGLRRRLG